jgi:CubicO group peptidase (beta-lactamase class C family)
MVLLCVLQLIDRGKLELDARLATYWPAFGQNGKDKVTLREFLTHRGAFPCLSRR